MENKKDNSGRPWDALYVIIIGFTVLVLFLMLFGSTACAQEPRQHEYYSIEDWNENNYNWQNKLDSVAIVQNQDCDSLAALVDSLDMAATGWYKAFQYVSDTSIKEGDHYFEIHDTVTGNWSKITTKGDEVWLTYYVDNLRYHFWVIDRGIDNKHFEFWIGDGNGASNIIRMDTTQFRIDYKDLNKYFE